MAAACWRLGSRQAWWWLDRIDIMSALNKNQRWIEGVIMQLPFPDTGKTLFESPAATILKDQEFSFLQEGPPIQTPLPDGTMVLAEIRQAISAIAAERLVTLVLYGSRARGDWDPSSDVDIAAVIDGLSRDEHRHILDVVADIEVRHGFFVSLVLFSAEEFAKLLARERRVALDIQREGVPL